MRLGLFQNHGLEGFQSFHDAFHEIVGARHSAPNGLNGDGMLLHRLLDGMQFAGQGDLQAGGLAGGVRRAFHTFAAGGQLTLEASEMVL